jgi:CDP-L-myo-inositol myo-inositolphosphotransferase
VILAAGRGSRIRERDTDLPKPLHRVAGLTLIKRTALTLARAGVNRVYVVVGFMGDTIRAAVEGDPDFAKAGVTIEFIENHDWEKSNGVSVLAARERVRGSFLLSMCDHVYDPELPRRAAAVDMTEADLYLCVDRRVAEVYDIDDATKVRTEDSRIVDIGKSLPDGSYDAIDCGVFAVGPALFTALEAVRAEKGDCSLSDGVRLLAEKGRARTTDIGHAFWQDVDTAGASARAEKMLLANLRKPSDGPVSRWINRALSLAVTRRLLDTNVTPNQMTVVATIVGVLGVWLAFKATWTGVALGALLVQCQSILDGCDGEIARLKFKSSRFGEWLDNVLDDHVNLAFCVGLAYSSSRLYGQRMWLWMGVGVALSMTAYNALVYAQLAFVHRSGNPFHFRWWFQKDGADLTTTMARPGIGTRLAAAFRALGRRDVFLLAFLLLAVLRVPQVAVVWYAVIAAGYLAMTLIHLYVGGISPPVSHAAEKLQVEAVRQ